MKFVTFEDLAGMLEPLAERIGRLEKYTGINSCRIEKPSGMNGEDSCRDPAQKRSHKKKK